MTDPEGVQHVCCDDDWKVEMDYLKAKVDAGGEVILTQLFYDTEVTDALHGWMGLGLGVGEKIVCCFIEETSHSLVSVCACVG